MKMDEGVIDLWNNFFSLRMIADVYDVSAPGVRKFLKRHGIDTSETKFDIVCDYCGKDIRRARCQIRNRIKNYCDHKCYADDIRSPESTMHRQGSRVARQTVRDLGVALVSENIVHHKDGNQDNNAAENLIVFKNSSDHSSWHRAGAEKSGVVPIWRGDRKPLVAVKRSETPLEKASTAADNIRLKMAEDRQPVDAISKNSIKEPVVFTEITDLEVEIKKRAEKKKASSAYFNPQPKTEKKRKAAK